MVIDSLHLTTVKALKDWCKIKDADALVPVVGGDSIAVQLERLIVAASAFITNRISRTVVFATEFTETRNGNGKQTLFPQVASPINTITSVKINETLIPAISPTQKIGYYFDKDALYLSGYVFEHGIQNITIVWNCGLALDGKEAAILEECCLELCNLKWERRGHPDQITVKNGQNFLNTTFSMDAVPKEVKAALNDLRTMIPPIY